MADNTTLPGTGDVIGADEISSVKYQRVKLIIGADNTNDGDVCAANPVPAQVFGIARTANPVAVANAADAPVATDDLGRLVVVPGQVRDLVTKNTFTDAVNTEQTVLAQVASTFLDVTAIIVANSSATAATCSFRDATGGTVRFVLQVPAGETRGVVFQIPLPQTAVNNNWTVQSSAAVSSLYVFMQAVQNI